MRRHIFGELGSLGLDPRGQTATVVDEYYGSPYDAATLRPEVPVVLRVVDHSYGLPNAPGVDEMRPADTVPEDDLPTTTRFADATLVGKRFDLTEQERPK